MAEGVAKGRREGLREGRLQTARTVLRDLLADRFGALPEAVLQRIEAATDPERLHAAVLQVRRLRQIDDLQL